jgi:hypothetical protein
VGSSCAEPVATEPDCRRGSSALSGVTPGKKGGAMKRRTRVIVATTGIAAVCALVLTAALIVPALARIPSPAGRRRS